MRLDVWSVTRNPLRLPAVGGKQVEDVVGRKCWGGDEVQEQRGVVEKWVWRVGDQGSGRETVNVNFYSHFFVQEEIAWVYLVR